MPIDSAAGALHVVALFLAGGRQLPPPRLASPTPSRRGSAGRCRPRRRKRYRNERMTAYWARPRIANTCSTHQERSRRFPGGARRRGRSATSTVLPQVDVRPYYSTRRGTPSSSSPVQPTWNRIGRGRALRDMGRAFSSPLPGPRPAARRRPPAPPRSGRGRPGCRGRAGLEACVPGAGAGRPRRRPGRRRVHLGRRAVRPTPASGPPV